MSRFSSIHYFDSSGKSVAPRPSPFVLESLLSAPCCAATGPRSGVEPGPGAGASCRRHLTDLIRAWRRDRAVWHEIMALDDLLLADIGLERPEVRVTRPPSLLHLLWRWLEGASTVRTERTP